MDKASASGAGDSSFESWADHWWQERNSGEVEECHSACMRVLPALAATKKLEGPHIRMPAKTADRTGVAFNRYPPSLVICSYILFG